LNALWLKPGAQILPTETIPTLSSAIDGRQRQGLAWRAEMGPVRRICWDWNIAGTGRTLRLVGLFPHCDSLRDFVRADIGWARTTLPRHMVFSNTRSVPILPSIPADSLTERPDSENRQRGMDQIDTIHAVSMCILLQTRLSR
jgi:hypothetical protein